MAKPHSKSNSDQELSQVLDRNIHALLHRRLREEKSRPFHEKIADGIAAYMGSIWFVLIHLLLFTVWIVGNLPGVPFPKFDADYIKLGVFASVEAIFLSAFVLIRQNRMGELSEKRNDLNLQISLLAEHEVTRLMELVTSMAERMGIEKAKDPEIADLMRDAGPEAVLDSMDKAAQAAESADEELNSNGEGSS